MRSLFLNIDKATYPELTVYSEEKSLTLDTHILTRKRRIKL